jgi:hypothetical protein
VANLVRLSEIEVDAVLVNLDLARTIVRVPQDDDVEPHTVIRFDDNHSVTVAEDLNQILAVMRG